MKVKTVYQTIKKKGTVESIHSNGPIFCNSEHAWLGFGYYFWDSFIENGHWWGKHGKYKETGYFICEAHCDFCEIECFDLTEGCTENLLFLEKCLTLLKKTNKIDENTVFAKILLFLREEKILKCSAIRMVGDNVKQFDPATNIFLEDKELKKGKIGRAKKLDLKPPIQICFFNKESMNLRNYTIVFPEEYLKGFSV